MNIALDRNYILHQARKAVWVIHSRGRFREFKELKIQHSNQKMLSSAVKVTSQ